MKQGLRELRRRLRLPFWHRADIEAEIAAHLQEAAADLREQGVSRDEAKSIAVQRLGDIAELAASLQEIHRDWFGGATVQQRFTRVATVVVIVLCLLAVPIVPPLREAFRAVTATYSSGAENHPNWEKLARAAQARPGEVYAQLALAEEAIARQTIGEKPDPIAPSGPVLLQKAAAHFPNSPAAHFRLALNLLDYHNGPDPLEVEERSTGASSAPKLNSAQRQQLVAAISHLTTAAALAPDNAAPSYFLAYALYADSQEGAAEVALRAASGRPHWSLYSKEIITAWLSLYEQSGAAPILASGAGQFLMVTEDLASTSRMRSLARFITARADRDRLRGDHNRAIFYYESVLRLSKIIGANARSTSEGYTSGSIISIASASFISERERAQVKALAKTSREQASARKATLRNQHFRDYLTRHGRADLARRYARDAASAKKFRADVTKLFDRSMADRYVSVSSLTAARVMAAWLQLSFVLGLLVLVGILSLLLRWRRDRGLLPQWQWWEWGVLSAISFAPPYLVSIYYARTSTSLSWEETTKYVDQTITFMIASLTSALAGALLFLILSIVGCLLKRRRLPSEARLGRFRSLLAGLRVLLPPTFAALLILTLVLTAFIQRNMQQWTDREKQVLIQGELPYWKIGSR